MQWKNFSRLKGAHSVLSPSQSYWIYDDDEDFEKRYCNSFSQTIGTLLHDEAAKRISNGPLIGYRMSKKNKSDILINLLDKGIPRKVIDYIPFDDMYDNVCRYVNDAIGFRMDSEVCLYYSENCFGHADAIDFNDKKNMLRIFDLKTGQSPVKIEQLMIYAALFFLDYREYKVNDCEIELRIYQTNQDVLINTPDRNDILDMMDSIKKRDAYINTMKGT
ncbi:MAG: DUF2800 domain-containing protein [Clostridiales bacterium]|nr:DUF2800 domain-containing protein [Clostridiales bacterium]